MNDQVGSQSFDIVPHAGLSSIARSAALLAMETRYHVECRGPDGELKWTEDCENRVVTVGLNKVLDSAFKTGSVTPGSTVLATPAWYVGICKPSVTTVSGTTGSAVIGSTSAPWSSTDEGRAIIVRGAGAAGADLVTTISTVTTSSSIGLSTTVQTTVVNAAAIWEARLGDTSTLHTPWQESTAYSNGARPTFTPGTIANGSVDNSTTVAAFSINADNQLIGGLFLDTSSGVGSSSGILYGMAPFTGAGFRQVNNGDTLNVTATLTAASA